jgi:hypothetical protein
MFLISICLYIYCFSSILLDGSLNNTEEDDDEEDVGRRQIYLHVSISILFEFIITFTMRMDNISAGKELSLFWSFMISFRRNTKLEEIYFFRGSLNRICKK